MKKSKRRNNGYSMIIKLVAIVFCLVTVTFSWFIFSKEGWINPFEVNVSKVISVTISGDKIDWSDKLEVNEDSSNFGTFTEFSGNGDKLYIPIISNKTITGFYRPDYSNREHKDYVEIQTYIKTDSPIKLYLSSESKITPSDDTRFEDNIAGAVRVAFILENESKQLLQKPIVWAPNSTYQYVNDNEFNKEGLVEENYCYVFKDTNDTFVDTTDIVTIPTNNQEAGVSEDKYFMWGDLSRINNYHDNSLPLFKVDNVPDGEEVIVPMIIRVWVEGTDREAMASLIGGKVKMNLKFETKENR